MDVYAKASSALYPDTADAYNRTMGKHVERHHEDKERPKGAFLLFAQLQGFRRPQAPSRR
jgi:hypothetical protein